MRLESRVAVAIAPIPPLAWESPYAMGAAQENGKKTKKKKIVIIKESDLLKNK